MRYKSLTINRRLLDHDSEEKDILTSFSNGINKLGDLFDSLVEVEDLIISGIEEELSSLILTRQRRKELEAEFGKERYIKEFFIPAANEVENKLNEIIKVWESGLTSDYTCEKIVKIIQSLKDIKESIELIENTIPDFVTAQSLKNLINELGRFKIIKVCMAKNVTDRINCLLEIYNSIANKSTDDIMKEAELKEVEDISIDDL